MGDIINLNNTRRARLKERAKAITLCQSGFHKWQPIIDQHFDVKQGKLVTTERCDRCHLERTLLK